MAHGVLIPNAIAATNVDAYNRTAVYASTVDNGNFLKLTTLSTTAGEGEVFTAIAPSTANGLTGLWCVYSGDEIVVTNAQYKGLDPDPRNFFTAASLPVSVFKPQVGDIMTFSADCFAGTFISGTTTHANAVDGNGVKLIWANAVGSSVTSYKLLKVNYMSIGTGAIDSQRITSYLMECVVE